MTAAQKRQDQRDANRNNPFHPSYNPGRTNLDEDRERLRKHQQGENSGNPRRDPYEPGLGDPKFARGREIDRDWRCINLGEDCGWEALDWDSPAGMGHKEFDYDNIHGVDYWP